MEGWRDGKREGRGRGGRRGGGRGGGREGGREGGRGEKELKIMNNDSRHCECKVRQKLSVR